MKSFLCVLFAIIGLTSAYLTKYETSLLEQREKDSLWVKIPKSWYMDPYAGKNPPNFIQHYRNKRSANNENQNQQEKPINVQGGGGSGPSGTNVGVDVSGRLWQSQNGRHEVHGNAQYGQHFGGPAGTQPPSVGGGLIYRHRF